jgi:hypothetical protein
MALLAAIPAFLPLQLRAQQTPIGDSATATTTDSLFRVTIRPQRRIGAPPDLQDMIIRSADGNVMFFVEWLLRPKDQGFFDLGRPIRQDTGARYTISGQGDFSRVMGTRYQGLNFDEIAKLVGYEPTALVARFDAARGLYQAPSAAGPYDPLYSTFGKFDFDNITCNPRLGLVCGAFRIP